MVPATVTVTGSCCTKPELVRLAMRWSPILNANAPSLFTSTLSVLPKTLTLSVVMAPSLTIINPANMTESAVPSNDNVPAPVLVQLASPVTVPE